ncbi:MULTISPECIES: patatin-like phospholipase family protein [unclassified Roseitalea]|uniref:patatin-like phospholipase family protein n=1 Tax=unclassified Roseitalea TaxID=2639107 RepID=UPI00273F736C|nr:MULTISPECIES: patatin-like phospholipase family protein [unclassified Roseitalea]
MSEARQAEPVATRPTKTDPTVAIAFGGGGARGYAHIHIIEVLDEMGVRPVAITGSSIGAVMGAAMASGMTGRQIRDYTVSLARNRGDVVGRFWQTRPSRMRELVDGGFRFGQFNIERMLHTFLPPQMAHSFEELKIPTGIVATDYYGHRQTVFTSGDLFSAMAASAAIPAVFKAVVRDGRIYVDGGIFNPVPYDHLVGRADIIVGIDVVGAPQGDPSKPPTTIECLFGTSQLMNQSMIQLKLMVEPPDVFIRPPVSRFRVLDFLKAEQILEATASVRDEFKRKLEGAVAAYEMDPIGVKRRLV